MQTSLNLGILTTDADAVRLTFSVRSSVNREKFGLSDQLMALAARCGGSRGAEQKRKQQFFHVAGFYACGTAGAAPHAVFIRIPT